MTFWHGHNVQKDMERKTARWIQSSHSCGYVEFCLL
jgi:hypothetical protein